MIGITEAISTGFINKNRSEMTWVAYIGRDSSVAKMGAIGTKTNGVHIVGVFFFKASGSQVVQLLNLLKKNLTGVQFAGYAVITPEVANLPIDIPLNSPLSYCAVLNDMVGESLSLFFLNALQSSSKIL